MAGTLSGVPSTLHALATRRPVLDAAVAAGQLLGRPGLVRGTFAHTLMTVGWATVLVSVLPRRGAVGWGAAGGLGIGLVDMAIADRSFPAIAGLPRRPQLADHILFGALVGVVLVRRPAAVPQVTGSADGSTGTPAAMLSARSRCTPS